MLLLLLTVLIAPGCATSSWKPQNHFAGLTHRSAKIPAEASKDEIVSYVNQHVTPIHAWRSTHAEIKVSGIPVRLPATIAVEEPNHFRMTVNGPLHGPCELDLGSNQDEIWFWMQKMEPKAVVTCRHEEIAAVQNHLPVPFQPEWLMEVLCVRPLDASQAELVRDPENPYQVKLVSHIENANGQAIRKVTTIDLRRGEVTGHHLYDSTHQLLVSAELSDYRGFPNTKARLPHTINLYWAQQDKKMNLYLGSVDVNPPHLSAEIWNVPQMAGYPVHALHRDQLIPPTAGVAGRALRDKPKAITSYELDPPSGVWLQEQRIVNQPGLNSGQAPPGPADQGSSPYYTPREAAEFAASNPAHSSGQVTLPDLAPPFPDFAAPQAPYEPTRTAVVPASAATPQKKSRESLIDGAPVDFEAPVIR